MPFDSTSLNLYPTDPGVYLMKDASGRMLYIGKAKNLRNRLKQYFSERKDERPTIVVMMSQLDAIEPIVALTEKDALILESNLIKLHKPKYNILLKDDKTFISLLITQHHWPMFRLVRVKGEPEERGRYFGPYTSAFSARKTYDLLTRLFPLRQCSDAELASRKRPCILYDLKRCAAPCVGKCTKEEYDQLVLAAERVLKGHHQEVLGDLERERERASDHLEYERADVFHKMIQQIKHVSSVQHVENPFAKNCDALGVFRKGEMVEISLLQFREGRLIGSEHFDFHQIASSDEEVVETFLLQHYRLLSAVPPEILLPFDLEERESLQEILSESNGRRIQLEVPQKGKKKDLVEMAHRNAKAQFEREQDSRQLEEKMLLDLQEALNLTRFPRRIECVDTSHLFGDNPVAAVVSFFHGVREKNRIRFFRIKEKEKAEDISAMREALQRHFSKEADLCDLLIVDGGKTQLNVALEVFEKLKIASVDLIALTKEEGRHDRGLSQERIYVPYRPDPILLDSRSPQLFLLQRIRDETHRLAIEYHRKRTRKKMIRSELDDIPGIGPVKKKLLLKHFGSVRALKEASEEAIEKLKGISRKDKERIYLWRNESVKGLS